MLPSELHGPLGTFLAGVFGLLVGSFLNVVIHRLPRMLERRWSLECAEFRGEAPQPQEAYDLLRPRSNCPSCGTTLRWFHNIPLLSYAALRGRCARCQHPIGIRYPLVELLCGVLFACLHAQHSMALPLLLWMGFGAALLALAFIDWDTTLLPDDITLPLLWAGLVVAAMGWGIVRLDTALWGAVAGYLSLWSIYWAFRLLTGKIGMGHGDFKLLAALGAWLGWEGLIPVLLVASVLGTVVGLAMKSAQRLREGGYVPFGPFLAFGGVLVQLAGPRAVLAWVGL
jgi:leader peptidase (prepilin peptidase) / N-methyltransferase